MNIKLSNFEATELIREHFQKAAHPNVEIKSVEIEPANPPADFATVTYGKKTVELMPLIRAIKNSAYHYQGSPKIAAIKAVRSELESQGFFAGLADAKLFVEQFIP